MPLLQTVHPLSWNLVLNTFGLWEGQTDEDEIGIKYDILDEILYRIDNGLSLADLNSDDIKVVKDMIEKTRHKNSMPPVFTINS